MHRLDYESCTEEWRATRSAAPPTVGGAVGPELLLDRPPRSALSADTKLIMHIALCSDMTDLTASQTEACGKIIIYSGDYRAGNAV